MTDRLVLGLNQATAKLRDRDAFGLESLFQVGFDGPDVDTVATAKHVDRCVAMLWPGVDGEVGLCDHEDATDSLGSELVERLIDDGGATFKGSFAHGDLDAVGIIEHGAVTVVAFHEDLDSKRFHGGEGGSICTEVNRGPFRAESRFVIEDLPLPGVAGYF